MSTRRSTAKTRTRPSRKSVRGGGGGSGGGGTVKRKPSFQDPTVVATFNQSALKIKGPQGEHVQGETGDSALHKRGYRSARATHGVACGAWYYEVECLKGNFPHGHARLGWATSKSNLDLPVGYCADSYGFRDVNGDKVHKSFREPYGRAFGWHPNDNGGHGDVVGCYIYLGGGAAARPSLSVGASSPDRKRARAAVAGPAAPAAAVGTAAPSAAAAAAAAAPAALAASAGGAVAGGSTGTSTGSTGSSITGAATSAKTAVGSEETLAAAAAPSVAMPKPSYAPGYVAFFVNGEPQGVAYSGIQLRKKYYPFLSLYNGAEVRINYGARPFRCREQALQHLESEGCPKPRAMSEAAIAVRVQKRY